MAAASEPNRISSSRQGCPDRCHCGHDRSHRARFRLTSCATAAVLGAVVLLLLVATSVPLASLIHQLAIPVEASAVILVLVSATVGVVVARHQPGNPLGWLLILFTLLVMLSIGAGYYAVPCYSLGAAAARPVALTSVLLGHEKRQVARSQLAAELGGRYWDRTSDLLGVNESHEGR